MCNISHNVNKLRRGSNHLLLHNTNLLQSNKTKKPCKLYDLHGFLSIHTNKGDGRNFHLQTKGYKFVVIYFISVLYQILTGYSISMCDISHKLNNYIKEKKPCSSDLLHGFFYNTNKGG